MKFTRVTQVLITNECYILCFSDSIYKYGFVFQILGIIAGCLLQDHEEHGTNFQQLPYHRLLLILFLDMNMAEPVLESMNYQVLSLCEAAYTIIRTITCISRIFVQLKYPYFYYYTLHIIPIYLVQIINKQNNIFSSSS